MEIQALVGSMVAGASMAMARRVRGRSARGVIITEHLLSAAQTRAHVETLARWFEFIHHDDLPDRLARPRSRPFCLLTFDDGKRKVAEESAPELERLGVPAVFYVTTRFLTDGMPLWFDRQEAISRCLGYVPPELEVDVLKRLPLALIDERLDRVCSTNGLTLDLSGADVLPMSWDDARALARRGFTIGAHGQYHRVLTCEPESVATSEIRDSMDDVARQIATPCVSFAFPNGNYTPRLAQRATACGAKTVMTTEPVWVDADAECWRLPRVELDGRDSAPRIACKLAAAATGRVLANPDGTGRLYCRKARERAR